MSSQSDDTSTVDLSDKAGVVDPADLKKDDPPGDGQPIQSGDDSDGDSGS